MLPVRAGRRRTGRAGGQLRHHVRPQGRAAHLRRARQGGPRRLRHGCAQARHALGRAGVRPRIRPRHLHDRRRVATSTWGRWRTRASTSSTTSYVLADPETATDVDYQQRRGDHRPRILPQLDRQPHHLPRLVPALPQGRPDGLPRPGILGRPALAAGQAHRRRAGAARATVRRGCRPARPSGAAARSIARSTISTPRPSTRRAPRWSGCSRPCSGRQDFRAGMDLYFERHDGHAATVDEFVALLRRRGRLRPHPVHALVPPGRHAGARGRRPITMPAPRPARSKSPRCCRRRRASRSRSPWSSRWRSASSDPTAATVPLTLAGGPTLERGVITLTKAKQTFVFTGLDERPVMSLNRGFSAPVKLTANLRDGDLAFLAAHDSDSFNRWQAVQTLATALLIENVAAHRARRARARRRRAGRRAGGDPRRSRPRPRLRRPGHGAADRSRHRPRDRHATSIPTPSSPRAANCAPPSAAPSPARSTPPIGRMTDTGPYSPDAASAGRRALKNLALDLSAAGDPDAGVARAAQQYRDADNMTDRMAALAVLSLHAAPERQAALDDFYRRYEGDPLIIDKWFALQAVIPEPDTLDRVRALTAHPAFSLANPNRVRALIGNFAPGQPDPVQSRRRRRLRLPRRHHDRARRHQSAGRGAADDGVPELARARTGPARPRRDGAQARRRGARPVARRATTSWCARSAPADAASRRPDSAQGPPGSTPWRAHGVRSDS